MGQRFRTLIYFLLASLAFFLLPQKVWATSITSVDLADWHSPFDICSTNPPAESQLLSFVNTTVYGTDSGDFDQIFYYVNYQNGDSAPPNTTLMNYFTGGLWWKYPVASSFYLNNGYNSLPVKGLKTGTRTFQVNLFDSLQNVTRDYRRIAHVLDRTPPSYSGSFYSPDWSGSPQLRTISNGSYAPSGIVGSQVILEPYPQRYDNGGFGFDRVDLWVAYKDGDNPTNLVCPPNPPYDPGYSGGTCNPFGCASFGLGSGKAWYIGSVYGTSGGTVLWNTNGFVPGIRSIVANAFDNPGNRMAQNFLTYTGNGQNDFFARVDYDLYLYPQVEPTPTATPTPTPTLTTTPTPTPTPTPPTVKYTVTGVIFLDTNKNGIKDAGELNYNNPVTLTSSTGTMNYPMPGNYIVSNLTSGTVTISLRLPYGYSATYPTKPLFGNPNYKATLPCTASSLNPPSKNVNPPCSNDNIIGADFGIAKISYR